MRATLHTNKIATPVKGIDYVMGAGQISLAIRKLATNGYVDRLSLLTLSVPGNLSEFQRSSARSVATEAFDLAKPGFGRASVDAVTHNISQAGAYLDNRLTFNRTVQPAFSGGALTGINFHLQNFTTGKVE